MTVRAHRKASSLVTQMFELSFAVPQVVAHRMTRMALAGQALSDRDRQEFTLMVAEKHRAFDRSWQAMATETVRANQALTVSMLKSFCFPKGRPLTGTAMAASLQRATVGVLTKGLEPVHRTAVANAKRLATTKIR